MLRSLRRKELESFPKGQPNHRSNQTTLGTQHRTVSLETPVNLHQHCQHTKHGTLRFCLSFYVPLQGERGGAGGEETSSFGTGYSTR